MSSSAEQLVPTTLTVVMADTLVTSTAIVHENEHRPYRRRTVQIELTGKQRQQLQPRYTGHSNGQATHEEYIDAWLEPVETPSKCAGNAE